MKRLILVLFLVFVYQSCFGSSACVVRRGASGGTCSESTNEIGDRTLQGTSQNIGSDYAYLYRGQADCTGNVATAYLYDNSSTLNSTAKVCIYTSNNTAPHVDDTLIECSPIFTSAGSSTEWLSQTFSIGEAVTSGSYYWVAIFIGSSTWISTRSTTETLYYKSASGYYASPPASDLSSVTLNDTAAPVSAYVTIGN